jgi:hypothetical protein
MFGINKDRLVTNLRKVQKALCSYSAQPCDCKYGAQNAGKLTEEGPGCPEVTMASELIKHMTQKEFERICKRANITVYEPT